MAGGAAGNCTPVRQVTREHTTGLVHLHVFALAL